MLEKRYKMNMRIEEAVNLATDCCRELGVKMMTTTMRTDHRQQEEGVVMVEEAEVVVLRSVAVEKKGASSSSSRKVVVALAGRHPLDKISAALSAASSDI